MSNEVDKTKHSERLLQKEKKLNRKVKLLKSYQKDSMWIKQVERTPHKYHKRSLFSCGNKHCVACMNPRKGFKEKTMQERKFEETLRWD